MRVKESDKMVHTNKNPSLVWEDLYDEFDWFDFTYALGMLLKQTFGINRYVKVVAEVKPILLDSYVNYGHAYLRIDMASDCDDYGEKFLYQLFPHEVGNLKVYKTSNRKGLLIVKTDHDHPVNGIKYFVFPSTESKYRKTHSV